MKKQLLTVAATAGILFTSFNGTASAHSNVHTVKPGDSLWKVSRTYNVTINQLKSWNKLSSSVIYVNQTLSITPPHNQIEAEAEMIAKSVYTVRPGDTLWQISKKYRTSIGSLKSLNGLRSDVIRPGQKLKVSGTLPKTVKSAVKSSGSYTVRRGDNLSTIAVRHNLSLSALKSINKLKSDVIYPGQKLILSMNISGPLRSVTKTSSSQTPAASTSRALVSEAKKYIGTPYVWAGSTPSGFDCSGYLNYVFGKKGISIPRTVASIWKATKTVSSPRVGDLVFFETYKPGPSHAGIYLGHNKFIHAGTSRGVEISDLTNSYWSPRFLGAKTTF